MPQITVFADPHGLVELLKGVEGGVALHYVLDTMSPSPELQILTDPNDVVGQGESLETYDLNPRFVIVPVTDPLQVREIPQRKGGTLYRFEPAGWFVTVSLGGIYQKEAVIGTLFAALSNNETKGYFRRMQSHMKKYFHKIGGSWVSPSAEEMRSKGYRLTEIIAGPRWRDVMDEHERYQLLRDLIGTEDDQLFGFKKWVEDYEKRNGVV